MLAELNDWFTAHLPALREDLFQFLRFRSISTDPAFAQEMDRCAEWLSAYLSRGGLSVELLPTVRYPVIFAEKRSKNPKAKTLLIYGHYDVQPVDPLDLWESDPFEPTEKEGKIFARGACDDKGQIFYAALAALALLDLGKELPVHIKFCIEGEEEAGSSGLAGVLPSLKEKLRADSLLIVDCGSFADGSPCVTLGWRGIAILELALTGSREDLHSGMFGGIAYNPNRALAELLAKCWDQEGRVAIPGFYDDVKNPALELYSYPYDEAYFAKEFGIEVAKKRSSLKEANWFAPTLEINGMVGGYIQEGFKTVIPARSFAKISARLVPEQRPEKVLAVLKTFFEREAPKDMRLEVRSHGGEPAWREDPHSALVQAVAKAAEEATGKRCHRVLSGGSIPIVARLAEAAGAQVVGVGYGLETDRVHAPNEHFDLERFRKGFLTIGRALAHL